MADSAEEPLMSHVSADDAEESPDVDSTDVSLLLERNLDNPSIFVWLLTFSAGLSGLLFGYDTGVISATLVSINNSLGHLLSTLDKSLITSATALFALLISPISGVLADRLGRKRVVLFADVAFILGAVLQAVATTVPLMIAGRSIVGIAVGAGSFAAPLYISELSPAPFRGRLMTLNVLFITVGQVVAYVVGWLFVQWGDESTAWRWIVGLGAVPAGVQMLTMAVMPETPRWLVMANNRDEARQVLAKVFGSGIETHRIAERVLMGIEDEVREEEDAKKGRQRGQTRKGRNAWLAAAKDNWTELFRVPGNRRALTIACLLQGLQQLCGFNSLMYFSASIFTIVGFKNPTLTSLVVAGTNFIMTCAALFLIDRIGRRRILLCSIPVMAGGLLLCAFGFTFIQLPSDFLATNRVASGAAHEDTPASERIASMVVLISIMLYVGAYALGMGNVPWMQSELFPLNVRSLGSGISTSTNWGANFIVGLSFLPMMVFLTPLWTFIIYAAVCIAGWVCILCIYPETSGLSLEETSALLADGWGVRKSSERVQQ